MSKFMRFCNLKNDNRFLCLQNFETNLAWSYCVFVFVLEVIIVLICFDCRPDLSAQTLFKQSRYRHAA